MADWRNKTLADVYRLLAALEAAGGEPIIQGLIDRVPLPADFANPLVTLGSVEQLLAQTNGSTTLPDGIAALLSEVELPERLANKQLTSLNPQWLAAREIMGTNFFGVEEAIQCFGVAPTLEQLAALAEIPFSVQTLQECKDSHILVSVFPLSILDIRARPPRKPKSFSYYYDAWYNGQAFAADKGELGWHLVRKTPVPYSMSKTWDEQRALLGNEEETPTAQVMVYTIIGHLLATGERPFEGVYVRTSTLDFYGDRVDVGYFDSHSLDVVSCFLDGYRGGKLGFASARKS